MSAAESVGYSPLFGLSQRLPPSNPQAEAALLGAILANNSAFHRVVSFLKPEHFADPCNGLVYREAARLILRGQLADAVTLRTVFEQSGRLDEVGGTGYFADLLSAMIGIVSASDYGRAIHDAWLRRQLIEAGREMIENAFGADVELDGEQQISAATDRLMELSSVGVKDAPLVSIGDAARIAIRNAEDEAAGKATGAIRTGFGPLDDAIGALRPGWFYILGGRPSHGKSSLAIQAAIGVARALKREELNAEPFSGAGGQVLFFSLEMPSEQVGGWAACHIAGISNDFLNGERPMSAQEAVAFMAAQRELDTLPIQIVDAVGLSGPAMALRTRAENQRRRVRLVILDHLQKVVAGMDDKRGQFNPTLETGRTTSAMKDLARRIGVPVLVLAQLRADVDQRDNPRPRLADLLYAGGADADVAFFMFREERYLQRRPPERAPRESDEQHAKRVDIWNRKWDECRGRAEILVEKRRQGPLTTVRVGFNGPTTSFFVLGATGDDEVPDFWDGTP